MPQPGPGSVKDYLGPLIGGLIGGVLGLIGGPVFALIGAVFGAGLGGSADGTWQRVFSPSTSPSSHETPENSVTDGNRAETPHAFINGLQTCQVHRKDGETVTLIGTQAGGNFQCTGYRGNDRNYYYFTGKKSFILPMKDGKPDVNSDAGKQALAIMHASGKAKEMYGDEQLLSLRSFKHNTVRVSHYSKSIIYRTSNNPDPVMARHHTVSDASLDLLTDETGKVTHHASRNGPWQERSSSEPALHIKKDLSDIQQERSEYELALLISPQTKPPRYTMLRVDDLTPEDYQAEGEQCHTNPSRVLPSRGSANFTHKWVTVVDHSDRHACKSYQLLLENYDGTGPSGGISSIIGYAVTSNGKREIRYLLQDETKAFGSHAPGWQSPGQALNEHYLQCLMLLYENRDGKDNDPMNQLMKTIQEKARRENTPLFDPNLAMLSQQESPAPQHSLAAGTQHGLPVLAAAQPSHNAISL